MGSDCFWRVWLVWVVPFSGRVVCCNQADIITIDSDFDVYRFGANRKFNNLLRSWI